MLSKFTVCRILRTGAEVGKQAHVEHSREYATHASRSNQLLVLSY